MNMHDDDFYIWHKCTLWASKNNFVDGRWYILAIKGRHRPYVGKWDAMNERFVGSGLVGKELDEAIPLKSGIIEEWAKCPMHDKWRF